METKQRGLAIGAVIGAVLGAGAAWLLMNAPTGDQDEPPKPLAGKDLLGLTKTAAGFIRMLDDVRRRT